MVSVTLMLFWVDAGQVMDGSWAGAGRALGGRWAGAGWAYIGYFNKYISTFLTILVTLTNYTLNLWSINGDHYCYLVKIVRGEMSFIAFC